MLSLAILLLCKYFFVNTSSAANELVHHVYQQSTKADCRCVAAAENFGVMPHMPVISGPDLTTKPEHSNTIIWRQVKGETVVLPSSFTRALSSVSNIMTSKSILNVPGVPVPGAELLREMIWSRLGPEQSGLRRQMTDDAEFQVLDVDNTRRLINMAKNSYRRVIQYLWWDKDAPGFGSTKKNLLQTAGGKTHIRPNPYVTKESYFQMHAEKVFLAMLQAIYTTQYRIGELKPLRKRFANDPSYKIAILVASVYMYMHQMESLFARMQNFNYRELGFMWFLIIYERLLKVSIDLTYAVERLFLIHKSFLESKAGTPVLSSKLVTDLAKIQEMAKNGSFPGLDVNL